MAGQHDDHDHDDHSHGDHSHEGHDHDHFHRIHSEEVDALLMSIADIEISARVKALEELLTQKGLVDPSALDAVVDLYENQIGPKNGARVIARAWADPVYKAWLLADPNAAIADLGFAGAQGENMVALENTADVHNVVVCTLCSCYPWPVLGLPPVWYKSMPYRTRIVRDPRSVLAEFGTVLPDSTEIRVWDSNSEVRYLVVPRRPEGTEGLDEAALAALVSRDSMIGVTEALSPEPA
ncbi:nitrile hydratase subunit alpha [Ancylobacter sonchi]|uniref:nitrile hydratase subunit alpha n=1 Tax=Ancylobacter sonchi TaxID=1937790 RepID=UPI001BD205CB|nr:nitrile hydratase subunit alpha [Ancylobacter sonchi]MBS7533555.1 nitrile hydratase subunit alpha [Ancylobacter sonchi]